eukprot:CAMPEP_0114559848 /NCGR_PEP_ID=MMETSP0114-20121206/11139_1 /TAXON_ID=31324 /ORGANISM="Goniomonas sp, Strain m" /LENGTH=465 /DNA_ID=CAMNT_0001745343 /DNA_START=75 /DNA_END=1472 /DNA_ORIENTATION=+
MPSALSELSGCLDDNVLNEALADELLGSLFVDDRAQQSRCSSLNSLRGNLSGVSPASPNLFRTDLFGRPVQRTPSNDSMPDTIFGPLSAESTPTSPTRSSASRNFLRFEDPPALTTKLIGIDADDPVGSWVESPDQALDDLLSEASDDATVLCNQLSPNFNGEEAPSANASGANEPNTNIIPLLVVATVTAQFTIDQKVNLGSLTHMVQPDVAAQSKFKNQIPIPIDLGNQRNVSACVFSNGTITLAGCKTDPEVAAAAASVVHTLRFAQPPVVPQPECLQLLDLQTRLRKADVNVGFPLALSKVYELMQQHAPHFCLEYEPARYCGLKVRVPCPGLEKPICILLFRTGRAQAAGRASEQQLNQIWGQIASILFQHREVVECKDGLPMPRPRNKTSNKRSAADSSAGPPRSAKGRRVSGAGATAAAAAGAPPPAASPATPQPTPLPSASSQPEAFLIPDWPFGLG